MSISITPQNDNKIAVVCPYDTHFIKKIKQLGGKWSKPAWIIATTEEAQARALLRECFGTDGTPEPTAVMLIHLNHTDADWGHSFMVGPIQVLHKYGRDSTPRLADGCIVTEGELHASGGSRNNPRITYAPGTIIRASGIPASVAKKLAEEEPEAYQIISAVQRADALTAEELSLVEVLKNLEPERLNLVLDAIK